MRPMRAFRLILLLIVMVLAVAGCRRDQEPDEVPTAVPTAASPETAPGDATPAAPTPTPLPAEAVDPDRIDWPPQLVYSSPAPGEEVLLDGAITLRFDQPMDQDSVQTAFAVSDVQGDPVQGRFTWTRADTMVFIPQGQLKRQADYRVQVGETAAGANGRPLLAPIDLSLQTVGFLEVSQVIPAPDTSDVDTDTALTVLFNRPVVPLVTTGQQADLPQPLTLSPAVPGTGEWVSTSIYRFTPAAPLAGATRYNVTVAAGLADLTGGVLEEPTSWSFNTRSPAVVSIDPPNGRTGVSPTRPLTVTFNMPMDRASTEAAILVPAVEAAGADVAFSWSDGDRVVTLTPRSPLALETEYQVVVSSSAQAAGSQVTLGADEVSAFTTVPFPAVLTTQPAANSEAARFQNGVTIGFASPMDFDTLQDRLEIEPAPARVDYFYADQSNELYANFPMERNTEYRVTVPADAADPLGNTLGEPYTWRFTTADYDPIASFNLPQGVSQLSTSFSTRVGIIHRNVSELNVSLTEVGLPLNLLSEPYNLADYRPTAAPRQQWSLSLDEPDGVASLALADGALPTGVYFLTVDAPEVVEESRYWQNQRHLLVVADTNIVVKELFDEVYVWTTDIGSGQPVAGRNLVLYDRRGVQQGTAVSDANGFARFSRSLVEYLEGVLVVSNQPGDAGFGVASSNWNQGISPWQFGVPVGFGPEPPLFTYLYTDRPIYRPGDTLYFKGIVRQSDYGRYRLPADQERVTVTLSPAFFVEDSSLNRTLNLEVDEAGTVSGEINLPLDMSLGAYQLVVEGQDFETVRQFTVAQYRKPEFLVSLTPDRADALRGQAVDVTLEASYFFGGPAGDLPVQWVIYADTYRLEVPGPYYAFGDDGSFFYRESGPFAGGGDTPFGSFVTSGEGRTDANGRFVVRVPADLLANAEPGSRRITVEASVLDLSNFPVTNRAQIRLHAADTYVGVRPQDSITVAGERTGASLLTVDWDSRPVGNQPVEVVFYRRDWRPRRVADFGFYRTTWEPEDTEVDRVAAQTDADGEATVAFTPDSGGSYLAVATVTDGAGRSQVSSAYLWVADPNFAGWRSDPRERRMSLVADQEMYQPGDTARVLVQSPFAGPVQAWLTVERGRLLSQEVVTLQTGSDVLDIPLPAGYAPNVFVTVTAVKPVTPESSANPYADIRLGITELKISPEQLVLDVSLASRQPTYAPGETAAYDILVTDYAGNPVAADLSLALVDLAVLTLQEDTTPAIQDAFYREQLYRSQMGGGLFVSGEGLTAEVPLEALGMGGGGGGGDAPTAARALEVDEAAQRVRQEFKDTAYWQANLQTDANGRATVEIPLPDNLTTWRLSSKAATAGSLVGQATVDIMTSLPLLIRPVTPRFFTVGDVVAIGAIVNNNTDAAVEATVSLDAAGLRDNPADQMVTVPARGQTLVRWRMTVEDVSLVDLTFRVAGGGFQDATKPTLATGPDNQIPVYRYDAEDVTATAGVLEEKGRRVEAVLLPDGVDQRRGAVDVTLSPSLAAALLDSLEALNTLPYESECAHAAADRLLPNAVTATALRRLGLDRPALTAQLDAAIPEQIDTIARLAKPQGGWGWCYSSQRSEYLTAQILFALLQAQAAGYDVPAGVMDSASEYLFDAIRDPNGLRESYQIDRQLFFLYVLNQMGDNLPATLDRHFDEQRDLMSPYAKALLAYIYWDTGFSPATLAALLADINDSVVVSATGAHWEAGSPQAWQTLSTDIRNTAIVVDVLARVAPDNPWLPGAVRWLMVSRRAQLWPTAHESAWSIRALTGWMEATGELEASFDYTLAVNLQPEVQGTFGQANIADTERTAVPLSALAPDDVNYFDFRHGDGDGRLYYTMHLDSFLNAAGVDAVSRGVTVQRAYYDAACDPAAGPCAPIERIAAGQPVRVELTVIAPQDLVFAVVRDPLPAGAEAVDPGLDTSASGSGGQVRSVDQDYRFGYWGWWLFDRIEYRDEAVLFFANFLPAGTYQYSYTLQPAIPGAFQVMPATARQEFFPEVFGRSDGLLFTITE